MMAIMEGMNGGGGDMGEGMQCSVHPYRNNPGGICAFCLQEKLGKLVSSSFPVPIFPSSTSSSPSFRSEAGFAASSSGGGGLSLSYVHHNSNDNITKSDCHYHQYHSRRARIPFLSAHKKKKKVRATGTAPSSSSACPSSEHHYQPNANVILRRSKSTAATPRRGRLLNADGEESSPRRKGFWSFLYLSSKSAAITTTTKRTESAMETAPSTTTAAGTTSREENESPSVSASSFGRKVSRSRSVGCGSRSFSGDFFERISTGFGDCTLRRVESQREASKQPKAAAVGGGDIIKERVRCGGIFSGFIMTSSSSSSSSSSYWMSSTAEEMNGVKPSSTGATAGALAHGRTRSWGWAFASPIRAFSKPSSYRDGKQRDGSSKKATPNLTAIPSLLAVGG